jgi:enamine deaminase RidA (YjgF/YER057c/UK114 family)
MISRHNPTGLFDTSKLGFPQIAVVETGRLMFTNAVSLDKDFNLIGKGDLNVQLRQSLANIAISLEEVGAKPSDICQMRVNVVKMTDESRIAVMSELEVFYGENKRASNALIGVDRLARPDLLVEIEITAAID